VEQRLLDGDSHRLGRPGLDATEQRRDAVVVEQRLGRSPEDDASGESRRVQHREKRQEAVFGRFVPILIDPHGPMMRNNRNSTITNTINNSAQLNSESIWSFSDEMPLSTAFGLTKNAMMTPTVSTAPNRNTVGSISSRNFSIMPDSASLIALHPVTGPP